MSVRCGRVSACSISPARFRPGGKWLGDERVLDIGCGRGLMVVGAAQRLSTGTATGIDIWRAEDQAANSPEAAIENARCVGVAERVKIETGDARSLPFDDASFDVVLSHWVIHNLPSIDDRRQALDEALRVLRPDGVLVLADIAFLSEYKAHIGGGMADGIDADGGWTARLLGVLSGSTYRPQAFVGRRAPESQRH